MEFEDGQETSTTRIPCQFCGRKFAPESLEKHTVVCEKTSSKKRKTFDSAKQRIQGTELAEFAPTELLKRYDPVTPAPVKEKHIPAAKVADTVHNVPSRKNTKTTSPLNKSSNYERCPYCDRSFGPKAFDRHLEWCKEQSIRINSKSAATQEAKERLEARIKYRAPSFRSKRSITKEKYSPKLKNPEPRIGSSGIRNDERKEKENKMSRSFESEIKIKIPVICDKPKPKENKEVNFIRQNVLRCSYKARLPKKGESKADKDKMNNNFQNIKKPDLSGIEDWISANGTKIEASQPPSKVSPSSSQLTSSIYDSYDPFMLAEHQMKELFGDSNVPLDFHSSQTFSLNTKRPLKEDRVQNKENISHEQQQKLRLQQQQQQQQQIQRQSAPVKSKSCQTSNTVDDKRREKQAPPKQQQQQQNFKTSPTSAFSKYSSTSSAAAAASNGVDQNSIRPPTPIPADDLFEKEEYKFLPPIVNHNVAHPKYEVGNGNAGAATNLNGNHHHLLHHNGGQETLMNSINRYPLISLSNLSLCSSVSVDLPEEAADLHHQYLRKAASSSSCCKNADLSCSSVNSVNSASTVDGVPPAHIPLMMRSLSTQSNEKTKNQKKSLRMEQMLYGGPGAGDQPSKDAASVVSVTPDLFDEKLEKLNSFLDADDFDLMNSFAEFENALQNSCCDTDSFLRDADSPDDKLNGKLERGDSIASKMSVDSAYNSLNRKSPILYGSFHFTGKTSTPDIEAVKSSTLSPSADFHDSQTPQPKLSKFCHECGAKFPLVIAKFCCECGVRRLAI